MNYPRFVGCAGVLMMVLLTAPRGWAQQASAPAVNATPVPHLVSYSGTLKDRNGKPVRGLTGVTFMLYRDAEGGAPVWMETQNVAPDASGRFAAQLGATRREGLPPETFMTGEARWLAVQAAGELEQPRVLLVAVPYAMKAADAETIGGLPPSAFVLASPNGPRTASTSGIGAAEAAAIPTNPAITGVGTTGTIPLWDSASDITSSAIVQTGSGSTARIGINTSPSTTLDVKGTSNFRGSATMPSAGVATASAGKNSYPFVFAASAFNSGTKASVLENFRWQAEPVGNNTNAPSGTLNLLFSSGTATPAETGLKLSSKGIFTFAAGQTFQGTVTSVGMSAPVSDFVVSGSPVTSAGTLALKWNVVPTSANTPNAIVKRDAGGNIFASAVTATNTLKGATAIAGVSDDADGSGVFGRSANGTGVSANGGFYGVGAFSYTGTGVYASGGSIGVQASGGGTGVVGEGRSADGVGVYGTGDTGIQGIAGTTGVYGSAVTYGVYGDGDYGVFGSSEGGAGIYGVGGNGVIGSSGTADGVGVGAYNSSTGDALFAENQSGGLAAFFLGDVDVDGTLSKAGGSFKIDHPLDPSEKYLYHSFVESPDMKNIYDGRVTTDAEGNAVVTMPDWFEALNRDFRYQLTVIGQFAQAIVADEIANGRFSIKTDKPNVKVSWQVTGVRQDAWANAHRIPVEQAKPEKERGSYLHPELFGAPAEKSIAWARHSEAMKRAKEARPLTAPLRRPSISTKP